jgi:hypothetical protein
MSKMNDKLTKDFNKFQKLIKDLHEKYEGEPFANDEWNKFIQEGYKLFFPEPEPLVEENDKPCDQWRGPQEARKNQGGWDCSIYARHCDGITCKEKCDYYNKRGCFKKCYKN